MEYKCINHIQTRMFKCFKCEFEFKEIEHLRAHEKKEHTNIHINLEEEKCEFCGKAYQDSLELEWHLETDHEAK